MTRPVENYGPSAADFGIPRILEDGYYHHGRNATLRLPVPNFLGGLRGFALLWLRLAVAMVIAKETASAVLENREWIGIFLGAGAIFIGIGLLTMASAPLVAIAEIPWLISYRTGEVSSRFLIASILIALTFLGPGAYSIDRWLFGRKRLTIGRPVG